MSAAAYFYEAELPGPPDEAECTHLCCDDLVAISFGVREAYSEGADMTQHGWQAMFSTAVAQSEQVCGICARPVVEEACAGLEHREPFAWMLAQLQPPLRGAASLP